MRATKDAPQTVTTTPGANYDLWDFYRASLTVDRLVAGIPANPQLLQAWLEANPQKEPAELIRPLLAAEGVALGAEAVLEDQVAMTVRLKPEETHAVVFYRDKDGTPCYESRNFKAALKEGANILKGVLDIKSFRSKLAERVFVRPLLVPITAEIQRAERPISVMTMQGPRTSIKRFEFADNVSMTFDIKILRDKVVKPEHVATILEYLQDNGIGADRSQGAGTFTLNSFEPVMIG